MFSFFKRKKESIPVPAWAGFFNGKEYQHFLDEIDRYFKGFQYIINAEEGVLTSDREIFGYSHLGLVNVAQLCKQEGRKQYHEVIRQHFEKMKEGATMNDEIDNLLSSMETARNFLGVRLYPQDYFSAVGLDNIVYQPFSGELLACLVFDTPHVVSSVKPDQVEPWNQPADVLFSIGKNNIRANYTTEISKVSLEGFDIWFAQGDHHFVTNIVFDLETRQDLLGQHGALVALPHRHAAIIYPINNLQVADAMNKLIPITHGMNQEGPGSVSPEIFWYCDGVFTPVPYKLESKNLRIFPPGPFLEMLNKLN
ncbi:hypothetical protein [Flavihumibacter petaseus]|uniref:DUF1444 family protein n=1 Tax=Flavihumibacter petaseus NBRC 106054 TaxID=1220578 RepID=A0A0E9N3A5_9BACT|nr:hypothetical protein [Flavihumibacter petaseus]GAO43840.1 hypothetical protein FPE01S_02_09460 [Flavihumibacter petaseus NBRC 106054]